ncbi:MAG: bifunctional phosphopantothenoylcysteine decarboxylase/phosphopantothenate--cysteine ligase CoaBC [Chthoniobacterales bacterium]
MRIVVTAGPTREPIDPVRFISNRSSGKMGYAIAEAAINDGHDVTLISGPVCLARPARTTFVSIATSDELHREVIARLDRCDVLVMCAAVADYKPTTVNERKTRKSRELFALELTPTVDVLASVGSHARNTFVVGFAAETHDLEKHAREKLAKKNCDMIVGNDVSRGDSGMESDENEVVIFTREGEMTRISRAPKKNIARELMKIICANAKKVLTKKT